MSLTNAELNAWYDKEVLGNCAHERDLTKDYIYVLGEQIWPCKKCGEGFKYRETYLPHSNIPDYLSDPAVMWGILKKWLTDGHNLYEIEEQWSHTMPSEYTGMSDDFFERAVMLALKAKHESGGLENG